MWVPGAWELPFAARRLAATERYDALVAVGAVIRGDTPHFDYVAGEASRGLADASAEYDIPIGFGLLTCDTMEQAEARAGGEHGNKGWDAARRRARDGGPLRTARWRGRGLRRARARARCRRSTRGTCAAAADLERVATQVWDDLADHARRASRRRPDRARRRAAAAASSTRSSPTSRRTGASSASAPSSAACCAWPPPSSRSARRRRAS